jgi:hypothetical protein
MKGFTASKSNFKQASMVQRRRLGLLILLFGILLQATSCASMAKAPQKDFVPTGDKSVVFGRATLYHNDKLTPYDGSIAFISNGVILHISRYISDQETNQNRHSAGEIGLRVTYDQQGHFAFTIPPGRYYVFEFVYSGVIPDLNLMGFRSYQDTRWLKAPMPKFLFVLDVLPNQANYVGTIQTDFRTIANEPNRKFQVSIKDDYESARGWLLPQHPQLSEMTKKSLIQTKPFEPPNTIELSR